MSGIMKPEAKADRVAGAYCGKIRHATEKEAKKAAATLNKVMDKEKWRKKGRLRHYKCSVCAGWHLTSKDFTPPIKANKQKKRKKHARHGTDED